MKEDRDMNPANEINYPFTAIVGQSDMKLALCLIAVQPKIGGVRGGSGGICK